MRINKIKDIFLEKENRHTKKRKIKPKRLIVFASVILVLFVVVSAVFEEEKPIEKKRTIPYVKPNINSNPNINPSAVEGGAFAPSSRLNIQYEDNVPYVPVQENNKTPKKKEFSSQILGTNKANFLGIKVILRLYADVSVYLNENIPVKAKVIGCEELNAALNCASVEADSVFFGTGRLDKSSEKLRITFTHILDSTGKKQRIAMQAYQLDGTLGLMGDYSSGEVGKYSARTASNFIGGVAEGLQRREVAKETGLVFSPAGLGNALLQGLSRSALDYAQSKAQEKEVANASITVAKGVEFYAIDTGGVQ